ncbi:2-iminoacetate synthase [Holotrichia oblita]|nr:2-iminoacetate synthase [Holotrichia oblita]
MEEEIAKDFFINDNEINSLLEKAQNVSEQKIDQILDKAQKLEGLKHEEVAALLFCGSQNQWERIFKISGEIKEKIYGSRVVMFAPLYVSDYCVNKCAYCGFREDNCFDRRRLTMDEIRREVEILSKMGHKRLAVEAGEDPVNCPIEYILECLNTIYSTKLDNGEIRRANVNIAATTVENYKKLKDAGIGTYILFQETYHKKTYEKLHISGPKSDYFYHTTAFDRAMQAGIDDVGAGVLFGLYDYKYEILGLMLHNEYLEKIYGVGFHTISVPRICGADGIDKTTYRYAVNDDDFKKIVAILRLAVPFTGMIISTRESAEMRKELIRIGISQISGGSSVEVGGYALREKKGSQFDVADNRSADDIIYWLMEEGLIPSFCTACYRTERTGDRFMRLAKSGEIKNVCLPNALLTLKEYSLDYGGERFRELSNKIINNNLKEIDNDKVKGFICLILRSVTDAKTPLSERIHITIFGETNSGKSSLFNAITGVNKAIVSPVAGTTTDPVYRAMELIPFGAVVITDTAGLNDDGVLGADRAAKTMRTVTQTDYAVFAVDIKNFNKNDYIKFIAGLDRLETPYTTVFTKADLYKEPEIQAFIDEQSCFKKTNIVSVNDKPSVEAFKLFLANELSKIKNDELSLIGGLLPKGGVVLMVAPIDSEAPKGRLILPQVQLIRDCLDNGIRCVALTFEFTSGRDFPEDLSKYALIVHCGACMITRKEMVNRINHSEQNGIPITNYGVALAYAAGVLERSVEAEPSILGLRTLKTVIAVALSALYMKYIVGDTPFFACIGAVVAVERTMAMSIKMSLIRNIGTVTGGLIGICAALITDSIVLMAFGLVPIIYINNRIGKKESIVPGAIVYFAVVYLNTTSQAFQYDQKTKKKKRNTMFDKIFMPREAETIIHKLKSRGFDAYIVGGCVRDSLLKKIPSDYDITTSASPQQIMSVFRGKGYIIIPTGIKHGTVTVVINKKHFEVTTFRIDGEYTDGRRPDKVSFTSSLLEDLKRRDFTINAMAYNDESGLIDYFGGRSDLEKGIIRCVGNAVERFNEDYLRMLRAYRFAAVLDFKIEQSVLDAIKINKPKISQISAERIRVEFDKLLLSGKFSIIEDFLDDFSENLIPDVFRMKNVIQNNKHHCYDVYRHTIEVLKTTEAELPLRLAALFHDTGKPFVLTTDEQGVNHFHNHAAKSAEIASQTMKRLKYDNQTHDTVFTLVKFHDYNFKPEKKAIKKLLGKFGVNLSRLLLKLYLADTMGKSDYAKSKRLENAFSCMRLLDDVIESGEPCSVSDLAVNGKDVMDMLNIKPGKEVGDALAFLLEQVIIEPELNERERLLPILDKYTKTV